MSISEEFPKLRAPHSLARRADIRYGRADIRYDSSAVQLTTTGSDQAGLGLPQIHESGEAAAIKPR